LWTGQEKVIRMARQKLGMSTYGAIGVRPPKPDAADRQSYPPVGRGRGESLTSERRMAAQLRSLEALRLRRQGYSWKVIAAHLGYRDASGPWRAVRRTADRVDAMHRAADAARAKKDKG
jgi:hypothetical protein